MEPEQSGFHWQVNIYFQFYILILGSVEVPYGVHLPPLSQIKSFPPVLLMPRMNKLYILQVPVYI